MFWALFLVAILSTPATQAADCSTAPSPYDCAVAQVEQQEFSAAIDTLTRILTQTPTNLKALNLLGIALTSAGRAEEASARFQQALAIDPFFVPARKNLAINEFARGKLTEAQADFARVLARAPDDEVTHLYLAEIAFQRKQLRAALPHYQKAHAFVSQSQNPTWIMHYVACLLDRAGQSDRADTAKAVTLLDRLPKDDAASAFDAGVLLGRAEAYHDAARFFAAARNGYKDPYAAAYNQVLMLINAGDATTAIHVADELFAQGMKRAELYSLVAQAYLETERIKEAYDALREATRLEPNSVEHYVDLAMICVDHQNFDLGLEIVDIGLKHRPESSLLYLQRGVLLAMKGSIEQAAAAFAQASTAAPNDPVPYVAQSMIWMQTGQAAKAVDVLRARTRVNQKDAVIFYALGVALMRAGASPEDAAGTEATNAFASAVRLNPEFPQARAELGKLLLKRGDTDGAITHLEKAVALDAENAAPAYVLAQAYRKRGDVERARDLLARVSTINTRERGDDPDHELKRVIIRIVRDEAASKDNSETGKLDDTVAAPHFRLGLEYDRAGRTREAIAEYQAALQLQPELIDARYGLSIACAEVGDLDGAIALLRQVIAARPQLAEAHYNLGLHLWQRFKASVGPKQTKDLDEAAAELTTAVRLDSNDPRAHSALGQLLADKQDLGPAIENLRRAATLAPDDPEHAYNLGLALRLKGDLDAAESALRTALRLNPGHALARRSLGLILRQKGDFAAAATELRQSVAQMPGDALGHHLLGTVLLKLGNLPLAVEELRQAVRLDPGLAEAHVNLAQALARTGRTDAALQEQAEIQRLNERNAQLGRSLILLETAADRGAAGQQADAIAQLREAATLTPGFPEAHYQLGLALLRSGSGNVGEAEAALRKAVSLDAGHARAHAALGRLLAQHGDKANARQELRRATELAPGLVDAQRELGRLASDAKDWPTAIAALTAVLVWDPTSSTHDETQRALANALDAQSRTRASTR